MKKDFIAEGDLGALFFLTEQTPEGAIAVFKVLARQIIPFDYGNLDDAVTTGIDAEDSLDAVRISSIGRAILGKEIDDLFYYDDREILLHTIMKIYPPHMRIFPWWIAGYLQADYWDIMVATNEAPFGYRKSPIEFISLPESHLEFAFRNPYGTETINPHISWETAVYKIKYVMDAGIIDAVIRKTLRIPWFTIYGFKKFPYDFKKNIGITKPIDIVAKRTEIESMIQEWLKVGVWTE